ncbi:MAG: hypothetical protein EXR00_05895 [Alphaproteobacteria bacterium]|nr:hypothetical protein [Alphaproteobacteria bacterium]
MHKTVKMCAAALALTGMAGQASAAASSCANQNDMTAIRAAAVQQRLMVAALTCNAIQLYNSFVTSYQKELQASDRSLQNFFRRLNGRTGTADYHAFKTKLANSSSMQSIGDVQAYCDSAKATFDVALGAAKTTLAAFIAGQTTQVDDAYSLCQGRAATIAARSENVPALKPAVEEPKPPVVKQPPVGFVGRALVLKPSARALVLRPLQ